MELSNDKYYQGILQLRNCTEEALDFVRNMIKKEKDVKVAKEAKTEEGVDIYLTSNKFLKKVGKSLKARFPGLLKSTSKLHTEDKQTGKKVYRGTILFRMPKFNVGDAGTFRGDKVRVLSVNTRVMLQDEKTGKKKTYNFDEVDKHLKI
jgi:NMD protein affecting ribosome stability and mRNA decay